MFLLFGSRRCYYACGGWNDFLGVFKSAGEAEAAAQTWRIRTSWMDDDEFAEQPPIEWWHVVDAKTLKIVAESEERPFGSGGE